MKKRYQLGYRLLCNMRSPDARYTTPYVDLPEFMATERDAYKLHARISQDYETIAEWRLVECR